MDNIVFQSLLPQYLHSRLERLLGCALALVWSARPLTTRLVCVVISWMQPRSQVRFSSCLTGAPPPLPLPFWLWRQTEVGVGTVRDTLSSPHHQQQQQQLFSVSTRLRWHYESHWQDGAHSTWQGKCNSRSAPLHVFLVQLSHFSVDVIPINLTKT